MESIYAYSNRTTLYERYAGEASIGAYLKVKAVILTLETNSYKNFFIMK